MVILDTTNVEGIRKPPLDQLLKFCVKFPLGHCLGSHEDHPEVVMLMVSGARLLAGRERMGPGANADR